MWYNIDFRRLIILMLPFILRKPRIISLLEVCLAPLSSIHYDFIQKRNDDIYKLNHNGQVCYLRKALNDKFDKISRRITIIDGNKYNRLYIYTEAEQKPKYLKTIYLRQDSDYLDTGVDFIVELPSQVYVKYELEAIIDYYKLASRRYKIEFV